MTNLPYVTITPLQLSDMFFNSELINWNTDTTEENLRADAESFVSQFNGQVSVNDLMEDFMNRL